MAYWIGSDGNVWVSQADGSATNYGKPLGNPQTGGIDATLGSIQTNQISDPNPGGGGTRVLSDSTTAGPAGPTVDPNTLAQFDQGIAQAQAGINRSGNQLNSAYGQIDTSFQDALNQLLLSKNQANESYTGAKKSAATDFVGAKNTIGANAGSTLSGILRLLGSRGAGGGSTARISAPGAVARGASLQRNDASNTFGANNQALDTNWNNFLTGYNNQVSSAGSQRDRQRQSASQANDQNRANLLNTIAQLSAEKAQAAGGNSSVAAQPYLDQANSILDHLATYSVAPINYQTSAYAAPSLSSYSTNPQAAPTYQGAKQTNDFTSPYLAALLGKKQQAVA
jgi:hypothetical protein